MADVSRNVVAVLLVLVIVVSGFGTWSVLSSDGSPSRAGGTDAAVKLEINRLPADSGSIELTVGEPSNG